jgi:hypothetical protein
LPALITLDSAYRTSLPTVHWALPDVAMIVGDALLRIVTDTQLLMVITAIARMHRLLASAE